MFSPLQIALVLAVLVVLLLVFGWMTRKRSCKAAGDPHAKLWTKVSPGGVKLAD